MLKGYRTIIVMGLGLIYSVAAGLGVVIPTDEQSAITTGILAAVGLVLRLLTDGKVGQK
jgi:hypothetical protein